MRVRALDPNGDMTFGYSGQAFLINSSAAVAQGVKTRLGLWQGEWFLDLNEGTPYLTQVVGTHGINLYDQAITTRILGSTGVLALTTYSSDLDRVTRALTVQAAVSTVFGDTVLTRSLSAIPAAVLPSNAASRVR